MLVQENTSLYRLAVIVSRTRLTFLEQARVGTDTRSYLNWYPFWAQP
jgi:hypothetical protein